MCALGSATEMQPGCAASGDGVPGRVQVPVNSYLLASSPRLLRVLTRDFQAYAPGSTWYNRCPVSENRTVGSWTHDQQTDRRTTGDACSVGGTGPEGRHHGGVGALEPW